MILKFLMEFPIWGVDVFSALWITVHFMRCPFQKYLLVGKHRSRLHSPATPQIKPSTQAVNTFLDSGSDILDKILDESFQGVGSTANFSGLLPLKCSFSLGIPTLWKTEVTDCLLISPWDTYFGVVDVMKHQEFPIESCEILQSNY